MPRSPATGRVFGALYAIWDDEDGDAVNIGWLRAAMDSVAPHCTGSYVGEADLDRPHRSLRWLSPASAGRLATLRTRYDPAGPVPRPRPARGDRR